MIKMDKGLGVFAWKRIILTVSFLLVLNGIMSWFTTPREEDPQLAERDGIITVILPGATPSEMERLIAKPAEDELAQVASIKTVSTKMRTDFMLLQIKLKDHLSSESAIQAAWDKVREAMDRAQTKFPQTAFHYQLDREVYDQDAILLAVYGGSDRLAILDEIRSLKTRLQRLPSVKKIDLVASPGEQLSVIFDNEKLKDHGVALDSLVKQLRGGNASVPAGYIRMDSKKVSILSNSFYKSPEELSNFPVQLKSGESLPLGTIAQIIRTPTLPESESMAFNGNSGMAVGIVAQRNVNLQEFGEKVRGIIEEFKNTESFVKKGLKIDEISFQPHYVEERIFEIALDLLKSIFLVGGVLVLMLGLRVGSIVALQVPLVTAIAFGLYSLAGGVLNQISVAALILAIGLLVDNVVVVVDGIQEKLDQGLSALEAAEGTRKEFLIPLAAGTLTTIAAFMPILLAKGTTSDFTRAIGTVATIALLCSYFFCIFATPIIAAWLLRKGKARQWHFVTPLGSVLGSWVHKFPKIIISGAVVLVFVAVFGFKLVKKQFFPLADRDMVIVDLQLPEGTHYQTTLKNAKLIEAAVSKDPRVLSVTTLVGRGVPPFYYNLPREPNSPHLAQFILRTKSPKDAKNFKKDMAEPLQELIPFGTVIVKEIAQGPVVKAPVEVRVYANDPLKLQTATQNVLAAVRSSGAVDKVRTTLGVGSMNLRLDVNDSAAVNFGVTRAEVAGVLLAFTRGIPITTYRGSEEPFSITLTSKTGENSTGEDLGSAYIGSTRTENLSVDTLTSKGVEFTPTVLDHRNRMPVSYVYAELAPGISENNATLAVRESLGKLPVAEGVQIEMGGANAESSEANKTLFMALPMGLFLLLLSLMFEFNSYRRVGIILTTIPLCAVGAVPGLILSDSTFGFMTLLGFFTLAGTVIHNGIFLIDYIDHKMHEGESIEKAITEGIQRRTRPIILTAVATIVELLPLTLSKSTLWPPFAWAIISGLSVSTLMTLLVLPSIYLLMFRRKTKPEDRGVSRSAIALVGIIFLLLITSQSGFAETTKEKTSDERQISLKELLEKAKTGPDASAEKWDAEKSTNTAKMAWRGIYMPKLGLQAEYEKRDRDIAIKTPVGPLGANGGRDMFNGGIELTQPVIDASGMLYKARAADRSGEAAELKALYGMKEAQSKAVTYYLSALEARAKRFALEDYVKNLMVRRNEIQRLFELGRVGESDLLKVKLGIEDGNQGIRELRSKENFLGEMIALSIGETGKVSPADLPVELPKKAKAAKSSENKKRDDILALEKQIEASDLKVGGAYASNLPKLDLFARYSYYDQKILTEDHWMSFGVKMTWPLFNGAISYAEAKAAIAERTSLEMHKISYERAMKAQVKDSEQSMEIKSDEYQERLESVKKAERISDLEFRRFRSGKVTVNNLIDAEDILKDRKEKAAVSKIHWYQEWFSYQLNAGQELSPP